MTSDFDLMRKEILLSSHRQRFLKNTLKAFKEGTSTIRERMNRLLDRTVDRGGFSSSAEAKRWLKENCNSATVKDLYSQIRNANLTDAQRQDAIKRMDTLSRGYGFTRQKALEETVRLQTASITNAIKEGNLPEFQRMGRDVHAHTMFEVQKKARMGFKLDSVPTKLINGTIDSAFKGTTSVGYVKTVTDAMKTDFIKGLLEGKSTADIKMAVTDAEGKQQWVSKAFARTMLTEVSNEVEAKSLEDAGFESYEYVCNLDERTCPVCGRLDGKVFKLKDKQVGVNFPPMHRNCRCTTAPAMTKDAKARMSRKFNLRDEKGRKHYDTVTADMTYEDWAKKYYPKGSEKLFKETVKNPTIEVDNLHPKEIASAPRGKPMDVEDADRGNANPNFGRGGGYTTNCQTCVVVYEARRRGYDIEALPNLGGEHHRRLETNTTLAWKDAESGNHPAKEHFLAEDLGLKMSPSDCTSWMDSVIKDNQRYSFEYVNKGCRYGHIISADKVDGVLRLIDPQCGETVTGRENIEKYVQRNVMVRSKKVNWTPSLTRVDNREFDLEMVDHIVKKKEARQ